MRTLRSLEARPIYWSPTTFKRVDHSTGATRNKILDFIRPISGKRSKLLMFFFIFFVEFALFCMLDTVHKQKKPERKEKIQFSLNMGWSMTPGAMTSLRVGALL